MLTTALLAFLAGSWTHVPTELVTTKQVRALSLVAARDGQRASLRGVVTYAAHPHDHFYLQDKSGGLRIDWPHANRVLNPGDRVEVRGRTAAGPFAPRVLAAEVRVTPGTPCQRPAPQRFNLTTDEAQYLDAQWVTVEAVLQHAWAPDERWLKLDLARGRGSAVAYLPRPLPAEIARVAALRGSVVSVCGVWVRGPGGAEPPHLLVSDLADVGAGEDAAPAPPLVAARDLDALDHDPIAARRAVRVRGVVTLDLGRRQLFLSEGTGVVQVNVRAGPDVKVGQRVEAEGFPRPGTDPVRLDNAVVTVLDPAQGPPPAPVPGDVAAAAAGKLEGRVARFTGQVVTAGPQGRWPTANVLTDGRTYTAVFLDPGAAPAPGSRVELVGAVTRQPLDGFRPNVFAVVVRPGGLTVLEGPPGPPAPPAPPAWWSGRQVLVLSAGLLALFALGAVGFRRQLGKARAAARRELAAREVLLGRLKQAGRFEAAGRLAGTVAHDFNNLLVVINGNADLLETEVRAGNDPDRVRELAAQVRRAGDQAAALTGQLLLFSRQRAVVPYPLELNRAVGDVARLLGRLVGDRISVRLELPAEGLWVVAEPGQLSQVLLNLAVNAADAMPDGGTFTLSTAPGEPGWVRLTVTDTGAGMSDEVKAHVFESGFTTKPAGKGTGLGLAGVRDIVLHFGGRIGFTSGLGQGTTFRIDLRAADPVPVPPAPVPPAPAPAPEPPAPTPAPQSRVVLLVEDEEEVRRLVEYILTGGGFRVLSAADGAEALAALAAHAGPVDLLLTDVVLPGLGGAQLATQVRAARPGARVLFMSGYTADELSEHGIREEQVEFLHKPFLPREVLARVNQLLAGPAAR